MMELLNHILSTGWATIFDVAPIAAILMFFQVAVLKRMPPNPKRIAAGFAHVLIGLTLVLGGLGMAPFPVVALMPHHATRRS